MPIHILYGSIEQSESPNSSSLHTLTQHSSPAKVATKQRNTEKLKKFAIDPDDIVQLSSSESCKQQYGAGSAAALPNQIPREESLSESDEESIPPGAPRTEGLPSIGSAGHDLGTCRVCMFAHSKSGCTKGESCRFCHVPHKRTKRKNKMRPCKGKRERYHRLMEFLKQEIANGPDAFSLDEVKLPPSIADNEAAKAKLFAKVSQYLQQAKQGNADIMGLSAASSDARARELVAEVFKALGPELEEEEVVSI